jgi:Flp pilus assembly pilin Flp
MSAIIFVGLLAALTTFNGNIVDYYESIGAAMMAAFGTTD